MDERFAIIRYIVDSLVVVDLSIVKVASRSRFHMNLAAGSVIDRYYSVYIIYVKQGLRVNVSMYYKGF